MYTGINAVLLPNYGQDATPQHFIMAIRVLANVEEEDYAAEYRVELK